MEAQTDNAFAAAVVMAYVRAHLMTTPDEAAGLLALTHAPAPEPETVKVPFGCVLYTYTLTPRIVPQLYVRGRKIGLGHYPYTPEGAELAAHVRAAAVAAKTAGGDAEAVRQAAREAREPSAISSQPSGAGRSAEG